MQETLNPLQTGLLIWLNTKVSTPHKSRLRNLCVFFIAEPPFLQERRRSPQDLILNGTTFPGKSQGFWHERRFSGKNGVILAKKWHILQIPPGIFWQSPCGFAGADFWHGAESPLKKLRFPPKSPLEKLRLSLKTPLEKLHTPPKSPLKKWIGDSIIGAAES